MYAYTQALASAHEAKLAELHAHHKAMTHKHDDLAAKLENLVWEMAACTLCVYV